jgi:hypothetical protein
LYFIWYVNEGVLLLVGDVGRYVIIIKLLDAIFNIFPIFIHRREIQTYRGPFFRRLTTQDMMYHGS